MLFKGSEHYPTAREISEAIEGVGGILNAATAKEYTVYWTKVPASYFDLAFDVLADMILNSKYDPEEVEKERKVIFEELNMTLDSPSDLVTDLIDEVIWGKQPIGRNILGTRESLAAITRDSLVAYEHEHYSPNRMIVSVAGFIQHDRVVDKVNSLFGDLLPETISSPAVAKSDQKEPRLDIYFKETEQVNFCLAVPALPYNHPDRYVLNMMDTILGHGMSSRLFLEIREKQGLCYSVQSYSSQYRDVGAEIVYAGVDPNRVEGSITSVLQELGKLRTELVPETELVKAKEYSKGRLVLGLEDSRGLATWSGSQELLLGTILTIEEVMRLIDEVSAEDVYRLANAMLRDDKLNLAIVGPYKDKEPFRKLLTFGS
jgi:predicted Zn-dependent peptidase